jgi:hypothetical protein
MQREYDINNVAVILGGVPITEFVDGDSIKISFDEVDWSVSQGSHGSTIRTRKHNNVGTCVLQIVQGSPTLDYLSLKALFDRLTGLGKFSFLARDMRGLSKAFAPDAFFEKVADMSFGTEASGREWTIKLVGLEITHGQNLP